MLATADAINALAIVIAETAIERDRQTGAAREVGIAMNELRLERDALFTERNELLARVDELTAAADDDPAAVTDRTLPA